MDQALYTAAEVKLCLSISAADARAVAEDHPAELDSRAEQPALIARWHDVRAARDRIRRRKASRDDSWAALVERGLDERSIAERLGVSQASVNRWIGASVAEIVQELGGAANDDGRTSSVSACMECGVRPRTRGERPVKKLVRGRFKTVLEEHQLGLCRECLSANIAAA